MYRTFYVESVALLLVETNKGKVYGFDLAPHNQKPCNAYEMVVRTYRFVNAIQGAVDLKIWPYDIETSKEKYGKQMIEVPFHAAAPTDNSDS